MRDRATAVAVHFAVAAMWAVGLSPAFFAVVVWDRAPEAVDDPSGVRRVDAQAMLPEWQVHAGELYAALTVVLLLGVVLFSLADPNRRVGRTAATLMAGGLAMYAGPVLAGLFGGHGGAGDWRLWVAPLAIAAFCLAPPVPVGRQLDRLRSVLRVYTWGSLGALLVAPDWAMATSHIVNFRLPVVGSDRLLGLTNHPILLGIIVTAALVLEVAPVRRRRFWAAHAAVATAVLLLAQSRTAWLTALVALPFLYRRGGAYQVHPVVKRLLAVGMVLCAVPFVPGLLDQIGRVSGDREVTSLHGRTTVWDVAMDAFHANPLWGYGPTLFSDPASPARGAYDHAHSQLHQTLGTSGLVGAAGLAVFLCVLVAVASRTARVSAGLTPALVALTLVTCVVEAPLRGLGFSPFLVLVVVVVALSAGYGREVESLPAPARTQSGSGVSAVVPRASEEPGAAGVPGATGVRGAPGVYGRSTRSAVNKSLAAGSESTSRLGSAG